MGMFGSYPRLNIDDLGSPLSIDAGGIPLTQQVAPPIPKGGGLSDFLGKIAPFLGVAGDTILAANGQSGTFVPTMLARQAEERQNENAFARWQRQYDYERANPKPNNNDTANDYAFWQGKLTPEQFEQWKQKQYDPVVSIPLPNGQIFTGPRSQFGASMGGGATKPAAPQPGTIDDGYRFRGGDPADRRNWEPVAAGGPTQPASGGFPDPMKAPGRMTSGRRTVEGNRLVGGKPNSHHLTGDAADYVGASIGDLRGYFGPKARYLDEGDHIHVTLPGFGRVPYYGRRGTIGAR